MSEKLRKISGEWLQVMLDYIGNDSDFGLPMQIFQARRVTGWLSTR